VLLAKKLAIPFLIFTSLALTSMATGGFANPGVRVLNQGEYVPPATSAIFDKDGSLVVAIGFSFTGHGLSRRQLPQETEGIIHRNYSVAKAKDKVGTVVNEGGGIEEVAQNCQPVSMTIDKQGNILLVDASANAVLKAILNRSVSSSPYLTRTKDDIILTKMIGQDIVPTGAIGSPAGPQRDVSLQNPHGIATANDGSVFVSDTDHNRVLRVSPRGVVKVIAGTGTAGDTIDLTDASQTLLNSPKGIAVDKESGVVYIADTANNRILILTPNPSENGQGDGYTVSEFTGVLDQTWSGGDVSSISKRLNQPHHVAIDGAGFVYVADTGNQRIIKFSIDEREVFEVAGSETEGWNKARPINIAIGPDGSLVIVREPSSAEDNQNLLFLPVDDKLQKELEAIQTRNGWKPFTKTELQQAREQIYYKGSPVQQTFRQLGKDKMTHPRSPIETELIPELPGLEGFLSLPTELQIKIFSHCEPSPQVFHLQQLRIKDTLKKIGTKTTFTLAQAGYEAILQFSPMEFVRSIYDLRNNTAAQIAVGYVGVIAFIQAGIYLST
jgi:DNA-binding beta-propeller fold protein YncE